jgi:hypothetical protein
MLRFEKNGTHFGGFNSPGEIFARGKRAINQLQSGAPALRVGDLSLRRRSPDLFFRILLSGWLRGRGNWSVLLVRSFRLR